MPEPTAVDVVREDDGELVGRVVSDGGQWRATTIFGASLGDPVDGLDEATELARREGLSSLVEPWWFASDGARWKRGWILEVQPDRVKLTWEDPKYFVGRPEWFAVAEDNVRRYEPEVG